MQKTFLLLNAAAGSADMAEEPIRQFVARTGTTLRVTAEPDDVGQFVRDAVAKGFERLIVAGGDGTISHAVASLAPDFDRIELGIVPLGTGNDLARALSIPAYDVDAALENAIDGEARPVDLVRILDGRRAAYLLNAASGGIAGKVAADVDADDKQVLGPFAYWLSAVSELASLEEYRVELDLDGRVEQLDVYGLYLANGRYVGGGFAVAPGALLDDGLLDITTIPVLPPLELLAAGLHFTLGWETPQDRLTTFRAARVHLRAEPDMHFSVDGESTRAIEATFEVLPRVLRIVPGRHAEALTRPE